MLAGSWRRGSQQTLIRSVGNPTTSQLRARSWEAAPGCVWGITLRSVLGRGRRRAGSMGSPGGEGGVNCFPCQLFSIWRPGPAGSFRAEAERGMDPRLCSGLPAPGGLRPLPVRGRGECVRARACAQARQGDQGVPGLAGGRLRVCVYLIELGGCGGVVAGCAGARGSVRARLLPLV